MSQEHDDYLMNFLQNEADKRKISLETLLMQMESMMNLINKPLPVDDRLPYVEQLLQDQVVGQDQADMILRNNPLLEAEVRKLVTEASEVLGREYGLEIPDNYNFIFDERLNRVGLVTDFVDPIERTVTIASESGIFTPVLTGHILGHLYQNENSRIMQELRAEYERSGAKGYNKKYKKCLEVIEGWAVFVSKIYAHERDKQLGISFYEPMEEELLGWIGLNRYMKKGEKTNEYQRGYDQYQKIFDRHGMIGAIWAASFITTYEELCAFANDENISFP